MEWDTFWDVLSGICLIFGAFLSLAAGVGIIRFPDLLARMHAATKPQVLGLILVLLGLELRLRSGAVLLALVLVALFQMLTSPVAAHMVARAGYRTGKIRQDLLVIDDLTADIDAAGVLEVRDQLLKISAEMTPDARDLGVGQTGPIGRKLVQPKITGVHVQEGASPEASTEPPAACDLANKPEQQD